MPRFKTKNVTPATSYLAWAGDALGFCKRLLNVTKEGALLS
ncbi:MAG TPA: hypothetical protein PKX18_08025 [Thermosynergistes sp.]|nr:hypothetical protein [Thermosynergistes sp.]